MTSITGRWEGTPVPAVLRYGPQGRVVTFGWPGPLNDEGTIRINRVTYRLASASFAETEPGRWRYRGHNSGRCLTRTDGSRNGPTDRAWEQFRDWGEREASRLAEVHHDAWTTPEVWGLADYGDVVDTLREDLRVVEGYAAIGKMIDSGEVSVRAVTVEGFEVRWVVPKVFAGRGDHLGFGHPGPGRVVGVVESGAPYELVGFVVVAGRRLLAVPCWLLVAVRDVGGVWTNTTERNPLLSLVGGR